MSKKPHISVLLPSYNCERYIGLAVQSILDQTLSDFELIIIDDASTDGTKEVIKSFVDKRIQLIEKPNNTGYTYSLNQGLAIAKGTYIARMDADDIAFPERFAKQVAFLDAHLDVVACGTAYRLLGWQQIKAYPETYEAIKLQLLEGTCFAHPTVMLRKAVLDQHQLTYDVTKEPAEDYELWVRLLPYGQLYNLQEVLLDYRAHDQQVSITHRHIQLQSKFSTRVKILEYCGLQLDDSMRDVLRQVIAGSALNFYTLTSYIAIKKALIKANSNILFFEPKGLEAYLLGIERKALIRYFLKRTHFKAQLIFQYITLKRQTHFKLPFKTECILFAKSLFYYSNKKEVVN